ncbi:MAG: hypothetical protein ACKOFW_18070, partial [Planctomycetaceae bacterium]
MAMWLRGWDVGSVGEKFGQRHSQCAASIGHSTSPPENASVAWLLSRATRCVGKLEFCVGWDYK